MMATIQQAKFRAPAHKNNLLHMLLFPKGKMRGVIHHVRHPSSCFQWGTFFTLETQLVIAFIVVTDLLSL